MPDPSLRPKVTTWTAMPDGRLATLAPAGVDAARLVLPVDVSAIRLCRPGPADAEEFVTAARRSSDLMAEWGSPATTVEAYTSWSQPPELARTERFLVRSAAADGALVGFVSVQQISAGTLRNGVLGYGAFVPHAGRGLMSAGVAAAVRHCFTALPHGLGLHRVEANVQPGNERSAALVRRLGFRHEGFSPRLLWLAGGWRDHDRYALTVEDWLPPDAPPDAPATAPATAPPDAPATAPPDAPATAPGTRPDPTGDEAARPPGGDRPARGVSRRAPRA